MSVTNLAAERKRRADLQRFTDIGRERWNRYMDRTMPHVLAEAVEKRDAARRRLQELEHAPWGKAKRDAGEELEFWSSKVAFLTGGR